MAKPILDEDEALELPGGELGNEDDEATGVADADDLTLAEIEDGPEDVGLDTDTLTIEGFDASAELDDEEAEATDDSPIDVGGADDEVDADGDEDGWTKDNEGSTDLWDDELITEGEEGPSDDGGLEGVDDPLLDAVSDDETPRRPGDDDDDTIVEDLGEDLFREIA